MDLNTFVANGGSTDARARLQPMALAMVGIVIYAIFIFKFYKFIGRKELIKFDLKKHESSRHPKLGRFFGGILHGLEWIIAFPVFTFFWYLVMTVLLIFLSKSQDLASILVLSGAVVAAVRVTSYYSEDLSHDLAKMLPFTLLGIYIVDNTYVSLGDTIGKLLSLPQYADTLICYVLFVIVLELLLPLAFFWVRRKG